TIDRAISFVLDAGVAVYGGFAGTETQLSQRDWVHHVTTLSGDIGKAGDSTDNSYHVVHSSGLDKTAVLDGFTLTARNPNGTEPHVSGGGLYTLNSSPTLTNVTFSSNSATSYGGGMYNANSSPALTNVTFSGNSATSGGGMDNEASSSPALTNVTFS